MSDKVLKRIIDLASKGYTVRFQQDVTSDIMIRIDKGIDHAYHIVTKDVLEHALCDVILYSIDRLVEMIDA